jgi:methyl-accepting chemotaxis protein
MDALIFLRSFSKEHFDYEEQVLAEHNYPALAAHVELHKIILSEIELLWIALQNGEEISERVIRRMRSWVLDHINIEDAAFADFFKSADSSKLPASVISQ